MSTSSTIYDVLIIGAGPGGLACATALARQLRTTAVFDSGLYRNARATHMHNYLGFDHVPPSQFRAKARADLLARYNTTTFIDREITSIQKLATTSVSDPTRQAFIFKAVDSTSEAYYGRVVVLATGVTDIMPDSIPGFADCWGRGIFHCLFCHGYEDRGGEHAGVLAGGVDGGNANMLMHFGHMAAQLAKKVTIYTNGNDAAASEVEGLVTGTDHFAVDRRRIAKVEMAKDGDHEESGIVVHFEGGDAITLAFLAHGPKTKVNGPFVEQLGLNLAANGDIQTVNMFNETSVPGVYAGGDCSAMVKAVAMATTSGGLIAGGLTGYFASNPKDLVIPS